MGSLYIHIPFCLSKCFYCSFSSSSGQSKIFNSYVSAVKKELTLLALNNRDFNIKTLFLGGGTPTVLSAPLLSSLINHCLEVFGVREEAEISIEANPGTVDLEYLECLRATGCNRISFGIQSFDSRELQAIGRLHDQQQAVEAVRLAQQAGFDNISLDLMYGLPGQSVESWQYSLQKAVTLNPSHLSLYQLTIEQGTLFYSLQDEDMLILPEEEEILQMDEVANTLCEANGLTRYEISNYARFSLRCLHNMNYWFNDEYLAAGVAAVSYVGGVREKRISDPKVYIEHINTGNSVVIEKESLLPEDSFRETVIMGLRLTDGVSRERLFNRYGLDIEKYYGKTLYKLVSVGLVELSTTHMKITAKGRPLSNLVMAELV